MLRNMRVFALKFKHQLNQSTKGNSAEALQLAYASVGNISLDLPQMYFLTSGEPDGGASQILDIIDEFDKGRNIPVNSIAFIMAADIVAKQFVKDLARKTGGFFRSIEQASLHMNRTMRESSDKSETTSEINLQQPTQSDRKTISSRSRDKRGTWL